MTDQELLQDAREYQNYLKERRFFASLYVCLKHILLEDHDQLTDDDIIQIDRIEANEKL